MTRLELAVHCMTPFTPTGALDEHALRLHLQRMSTAGVSVTLGTPGAGEGQVLTDEELGRIAAIAMEVCGGRLPVRIYAREAHSAAAIISSARAASAAGVDAVGVFPLQGGHGMRPTVAEQAAYYDEIVAGVPGPLGLILHGSAGYLPPVELVARLCRDANVPFLHVSEAPSSYVMKIRDAVPPAVSIAVGLNPSAFHHIAIGASVILSAHANIIPRTCRAIVESHAAGNRERLAECVRMVELFDEAVKPWGHLAARWIKMAMRVLDLPGGGGGVRPPLLLPDQAAHEKLRSAFAQAGVREFEGLDR